MTERKLALDIITRYQRTVPVDVWAIAKELGIFIRESAFDYPISGKIETDGASPPTFTIWLNRSHHLNRKRFTLAHEIAHYILHRDIIEHEIVDNTMYRSDVGSLGVQQEWEANQLAANILMPYSKIKEYRHEGFREPADLAKKFGVSEAAMRIRTDQQIDKLHPRGAEFEGELGDE